ncbi:MAG TPA: tetratricopeptide repeat protein [Gammaproteobacteria bacterium]|nr:tetratricopeptide repeat protein [Gammaproteobacteria bacterium]
MANQFILEASPEKFNEMVLGNSMRGPVMVNYWSSKAGPCLMLWPRLESLVNEYAGRFLLVNLNTDEYRDFAQNELGIRSVPTVQIYLQQKIVEVIHGAESEQSIRNVLSRHLPRSSDSLLVESVKLYNEDRADEAIDELKKLQKSDPENPRIATSIVKLLYRESRFEEMQAYINAQSPAIKNNEDVITLLTHSELQRAASSAPDTEQLLRELQADSCNLELRYMLVSINALNDSVTEALDQLLECIKIDAKYRDNLLSKTMVMLLNSSGLEAGVVSQYRAKMIDALSS